MKKKVDAEKKVQSEYQKNHDTQNTQIKEVLQECNSYKEATNLLKEELLKAKKQMEEKPCGSQREENLCREVSQYKQQLIEKQKEVENLVMSVNEKDGFIQKLQNQMLLKDSEVITLTHELNQLKFNYSKTEQELHNQRVAYN